MERGFGGRIAATCRARRTCIWWAACRCCTRRSRFSRRCWRACEPATGPEPGVHDGGGPRAALRAFAVHAGAFPWTWTPQLADEWFTDLRAVRHCARSTIRGYQVAIRGFCGYLTDPAYGWAEECEQRFGTHPIQVIYEINAAAHVADSEADAAKRAFTRDELQALFDHADEQVARKRALGHKGWLTAFRDATVLKIAYAYGLRRNEARMLDAVISAATRTPPSSASTASAMSATARLSGDRRRSGAPC